MQKDLRFTKLITLGLIFKVRVVDTGYSNPYQAFSIRRNDLYETYEG